MPADLLVVGAGLIGTSVALALRGESDVVLTDRDAATVQTACARGAGRAWDGREPARHVLLAVPPAVVAPELVRLQRLGVGGTWSHVASVQAPVQAEAAARGADLAGLCGTHPMAGKETSGPEAATGELFVGRPWAICASRETSAAAQAAARSLAERCGAVPLELAATEHDAAVALVSHLPQLAASAVAAVLLSRSAGAATGLAGPGLQDTTRIAASPPAMWVDVLGRNAAQVAPLVRELAAELDRAADALERLDAGALQDLLVRGNEGRARVPVKRRETDRDFAVVAVAVPDRPGQLAGLLVSAAEAGVNVEDVRVEHLPGRPSGVIELLVHAGGRAAAAEALAAAGWDVLV